MAGAAPPQDHGECTAVRAVRAMVRTVPGIADAARTAGCPRDGAPRVGSVQSGRRFSAPRTGSVQSGWIPCTADEFCTQRALILCTADEFCAQRALVLCTADEFCAQRMGSVHRGRET